MMNNELKAIVKELHEQNRELTRIINLMEVLLRQTMLRKEGAEDDCK